MTNSILGFGVNTQAATAEAAALERTLDTIAAYGLEFAEISLSQAYAIADGRLVPRRVAELKRACANRPVRYTVHAPLRVNFYDLQQIEVHRDVVRRSVDIAVEIGATLVNVHCGFCPPEEFRRSRSTFLAAERESLSLLAEYAASAGVVLSVENTFPEQITGDVPDLPTLAKQVREVDSAALRGCLDVSHACLMAAITGSPLKSDIETFMPTVGHLHLNDCFCRPVLNPYMPPSDRLAFGSGDLHLPVGWGSIAWDELGPLLRPSTASVVILEIAQSYWEEGLTESVERASRILSIE